MVIKQPRIVIADRSELAGNLYRLLLSPIGATLVVKRRFEEARPHFFRRDGVDLGIFNSNIFGKKFEDIAAGLADVEALRGVHKIILCRATPSEEMWCRRLAALENTSVVMRPFHPDELVSLISRLLKGRAK
jgi:hypothetical protein